MVVGPVQTNCYILKEGEDGREAVLIDPGDEEDRILHKLEEMNAVPSVILLTHGHYDHILAVNGICAAYPSCSVLIGEKERPMVEDSSLNARFLDEECRISPDRYLRDGEELTLLGKKFRVMETPGHTAGSVCYYLEEDDILFAGDTVFLEGFGRYDLPTGDAGALMRSLELVLTTLPEKTVILPGHGGATSAGHEKMVEGFEK